MAYKVNYHGYDVTCETAEDLRMLLGQNGSSPSKATPPKEEADKQHGPETGIADLVKKLQREQQDLLRLISNSGTVARDRLIQMAGNPTTHEFAGLLIGITKSAVGSGIPSPVEKLMVRVNGRGPRVYQYKIRDDVKAEVKAALTK